MNSLKQHEKQTMKKSLLIALIIVLSILSLPVLAQTKQYAKPDPIKAYTFTIPAAKLDSIGLFVNQGSQSLMQSSIPANQVSKLQLSAMNLLNLLYGQLRKQVVADSIAKIKEVKPKQ